MTFQPPMDPNPIPNPQPDACFPPRRRGGGPQSPEGKARSRANAVKHGMRCKIVEPPDDRELFADRVDAWQRSFEPRTEGEAWLVAHAARQSVRVDRCLERENIALEEGTAAAEREFLRRRRAWARRTGHKLQVDPKKAYARLTSSAFGCEWLIDRWEELAADIAIPGGYWSRADFLHALLRLGFDYDRIPPGQPIVAHLYQASLAADRAPNPEEVDAFLNLDTAQLAPEARVLEQRKVLGDRESGRLALLAFVRGEQDRLRKLRDELWEAIDAPALDAACAHARTFDASPDAALARRYEASQSLELHRALNTFFRSRRQSVGDEPSAPPLCDAPAPNELEIVPIADANPALKATSDLPSENPGASPPHPPTVAEASPPRPFDVPPRPLPASFPPDHAPNDPQPSLERPSAPPDSPPLPPA